MRREDPNNFESRGLRVTCFRSLKASEAPRSRSSWLLEAFSLFQFSFHNHPRWIRLFRQAPPEWPSSVLSESFHVALAQICLKPFRESASEPSGHLSAFALFREAKELDLSAMHSPADV